MENPSETEVTPAQADERGRSTVDFPYFDLDSAIEVAKAVRDVGVNVCDAASLATKLDMAPDGGGFRMRLITAKTFGLLTYGRSTQGRVELTQLGNLIVDPGAEKRGRVESFMAIALYRTLFERLKGQVLPPAQAIERLMESLGVAPKQKEKARQVFLRSAKQAGLFELSSERMTLPPSANVAAASPATAPAADSQAHHEQGSRRANKHASVDHLHPFVLGLIEKLPTPDSDWDLAARAKWLTTAANIFDLMYSDPNPGGIKITLRGSTLSVDMGDT